LASWSGGTEVPLNPFFNLMAVHSNDDISSIGSESRMSIKTLPQSANIDGLQDWGVAEQALSQPPCRLRGLEIALEGAGKNSTGLWECEPGKFARSVAQAEVMHILRGAGTFTPAGGTPLEFRAGDTLFFPQNTTGAWDVKETIRKLYVILDSAS
jgi:uncharacterized cupin superfamily protein